MQKEARPSEPAALEPSESAQYNFSTTLCFAKLQHFLCPGSAVFAKPALCVLTTALRSELGALATAPPQALAPQEWCTLLLQAVGCGLAGAPPLFVR